MADQQTLCPLTDPTAVAGGYMIIISVEAIREQALHRWGAKQDTVWEFAQRQFEKDFSQTDAIRKLNDVDYLIAQADRQGVAAQHKAINLLKSILTFFLGVSSLSQIKVSVVTSVKDGVFEAEALSPAQIAAIDSEAAATSNEGGTPEIRIHPPSQLAIKIEADRSYEIIILIEPIWNVYKQAVATYYLRPLVFQMIRNQPHPVHLDEVSLRDVLAVDLQMMRSAASLIRQGQAAGHTFALHLPVHFRCLRSLSCRSELARLLPQLSDIRKFLVFCVLAVPDGAPKGALAEAVSVLKPHGLGVIMRAAALNGEVQRWKGLGLSGVSYDFIDEPQASADILERVNLFGSACAGVVTALVGHAISARPLLLAAWGAGFTHISGALISEKLPETRAAIRFPAANIYT